MLPTTPTKMATEWNITSIKRCPLSSRGQLLGPNNIALDTIVAYDIEIETCFTGKKRGRKMTLHGVPMFLVEAFTWLEKNKAMDVEGIFRKPGNVGRLRNPWQIFCGLASIPEWPEFTVHDVCTLIMRFFSTIRKPILAEQQSQILSTVAAITNEKVQVEAVLSFIDQLPSPNQATLGYLMRQLKKIADHPEKTQMSVDNLAICFAPAIFNDYPPPQQQNRNYSLPGPSSSISIWNNNAIASNVVVDLAAANRYVGRSLQNIQNSLRKKEGDAQQQSLRELDFAKRRKELQASVIKLLIQNANHICDGPRRLPAPGRGFLHRKSSDLQFVRSPIAISSDLGHRQETNRAENNEERRGRSRAPSRRSDKIWPRSASENPLNRTLALFTFPFGKNGSYTPKEGGGSSNKMEWEDGKGGGGGVHHCMRKLGLGGK